MDEPEAINALTNAKLKRARSGDKRHVRAAIHFAREIMGDEQIAGELGESVAWVAEHA